FAFSRTENGHVRTHNSGFGFSNSTLGNNAALQWFPDTNDPSNLHWYFDLFGATYRASLSDAIARQGFDRWIHFGIVVDLTNNQAWGTYDFGTVQGETQHFALTVGQMATLDRLAYQLDNRSAGAWLGLSVDSIQVLFTHPSTSPSTDLGLVRYNSDGTP